MFKAKINVEQQPLNCEMDRGGIWQMRYIIMLCVRARLLTPTIILALAFSSLTGGALYAGEVLSNAQQIEITSRGVVATKDAIGPRFSPNGKYLFYLKLPDRGMIVDATTFRPVSSHKLRDDRPGFIQSPVGKVTWSPDSKKIVYCVGDNKLYLLDIGVSKKMEIPLSNNTLEICSNNDAWVWHEPNKILYKKSHGDGGYHAMNLDSLQSEVIFKPRSFSTFGPLKPAERDALKKEEAEYKARLSALDRQLSRQNNAWAYIHTGYNGDGLLLSALDDSYHKLLLSGTFYNGNFDVSPNFSTIVYHRLDSELNYVRLGKAKARPAKFTLAFNRREQLSQSQQQDFEKFWQGVRVRSDDSLENGDLAKPSFWGDVYEPQVNPLTGKVVGPNQQKPKGRVVFESTTDTYSIVRTYFESAPIAVGDVVTNIRSDMVGGHGFSAGEIIWLPLKSAQGVPAEANTKETKQESGIKSNNEAAPLETQRGSVGSATSELSRFLSLSIVSKDEFKKFGEAELHRAEQAEGPSNRKRVDVMRKQAAGAAREGHWPQVVEAYNQILVIDPEDWNAWLMLSASYNELHQPDQTLAYATKALKRIQYSALYAIVGVAYGQKGDKEKFLTWLEKAVDGGSPLNPKVLDKSFPQYQDDPRYKAIMQKYQSR